MKRIEWGGVIQRDFVKEQRETFHPDAENAAVTGKWKAVIGIFVHQSM